jgi:hypothetical protein
LKEEYGRRAGGRRAAAAERQIFFRVRLAATARTDRGARTGTTRGGAGTRGRRREEEVRRPGDGRVHKTAVKRSVTAVISLTEPARLLKPIGNRFLTVPTKPRFSANRSVWSVYRSGFVEFENRYCSGFVNPGHGGRSGGA